MNIVKVRLAHLMVFAAVSATGFQMGCAGAQNSGKGLLPPPPAQDVKLSDYQPQKPFVQVSPGVSTRTVFVVEPDAKTPYHVDVQDILIAPAPQPVPVPLSGAGVFEVRTGSGTALIGEKSQDLGSGSTFSVAEGETLKIAPKADGPVTLRAFVVKVP